MDFIQKHKKASIFFLYALLFIIFFNILYQALTAIKRTNLPVNDSKVLSILTWKTIPPKIITGFHEKYPAYSLNIERYTKTNYISFLNSKLQTDSSVDLVEIPMEFYADYAASDTLVPLTNSAMISRFWNEPIDFLLSAASTKTLYGLPYHSNYYEIWYNQAIFHKYSLDPPNSAENFYKACNVLSGSDILPLAVGLSDCTTAQNLLSALVAKSTLYGTASEEEDAITKVYQMLPNHYLGEALFSMSNEQAFAAFLDSSYAMAFAPENATAQLSDSIMEKIDIQVTGIYIQDQDQTYVAGSPVDSVLSISGKSSNQDICKKFLDYYTQYDTVKTYIEETGCNTNIQEYNISTTFSREWEKMRLSTPYPGWDRFYASSFHSDSSQNTLAQKLIYNLITPAEFMQQIQKKED